jgi:uncharacterized Zn-binding protein involved in type VI secretion
MTNIAVQGDTTDAETAPLVSSDELATTVFIGGVPVVIVPIAPTGTVCTAHEDPELAEPAAGSASVFVEGLPVHRTGDERNPACGKLTGPSANTTVFAHQ